MACSEQDSNSYQVVCHIDKSIRVDTVVMYQYEDDYNSLRICGKVPVSRGATVEFSGSVNKPKIAFVTLDEYDWSERVYFVLENNRIVIRIGNGHLSIKGGERNDDYFKVFAERRGILNQEKSLRNRYMKMASSKALTASEDSLMLVEHKQLSDSLQRFYRQVMSRNDMVSEMMWSQFGNEITMTAEMKPIIDAFMEHHKLVK